MENHWKNKVVTLVMYFYLLARKNEATEGNDDFFIKRFISVLNTMRGKQNHMQSLSRAKKIERLSSMAVKQIHNQPRFGSETRRCKISVYLLNLFLGNIWPCALFYQLANTADELELGFWLRTTLLIILHLAMHITDGN